MQLSPIIASQSRNICTEVQNYQKCDLINRTGTKVVVHTGLRLSMSGVFVSHNANITLIMLSNVVII